MINQPVTWICSYDIRDPKRLRQIHDLLCRIGIAINYSVFYLQLNTKDVKVLANKIQKVMHHHDDVRIYPAVSLHYAYLIGSYSPEGILLLNAQGKCL